MIKIPFINKIFKTKKSTMEMSESDKEDLNYNETLFETLFEKREETYGKPLKWIKASDIKPERDCVNCVYSKDGHIDVSETCHICMWENQFIPKFIPKRINASDIKSDDEWMQENEWDEIYKQEDNLPDINVGEIKESEDKE